MSRLNIGVVGVGHLGALHAKMLVNIDSAKLVGVYDSNHERALKIAEEFQLKAYHSYEELLRETDAVTIAVNTKAHYEVAIQALQAGKHIFIEKPITETIKQAEELINLSKQKKLKIQVGHIERFNPALLAVEHIKLAPLFIESHRLAQFNPRGSDVAVVHDLMIHDIDIILSLVKSPVEQVFANGVAVITDTIDIANARIQFANGCIANVTASRISKSKMRKMRLFQKDAYISLDFNEGNAEIFRLVDASEVGQSVPDVLGMFNLETLNKKIVYEKPKKNEINALKHELELFIDAIVNHKTPQVTAEDGLRALEVAQMIVDKISSQQPFYKI
ncbi:MAG: Oxidoreductase, Gfo/Idh/MocA family [Ignavibacteriae bacterium]|nr:MAG: Oxidoreductase, Gfo/Idh/MocA family [Ignavibacteriota bacterium]